jgi:hypothetical protein
MKIAYKVLEIKGGIVAMFDEVGFLPPTLEITILEELGVPSLKIGEHFVPIPRNLLSHLKENNKLYVLESKISEYYHSDWKGTYEIDKLAIAELIAVLKIVEGRQQKEENPVNTH